MFVMGVNMKKISFLLLAVLICGPVFAEDYDEYDTYDDETYTTYETPKKETRDTYAGFRIHRNAFAAYKYDIQNGKSTTIRSDNFSFGLNIGNRLTDNVKLEFETMYTGTSEMKHDTDFDYDVWSHMLNVYLYKNYGGAVEPYVGLGVGFSGIWGDIDGALPKSSDSNIDMSFAIMTGINFALNKYIDLNLGLRYANYGKVKYKQASTHVDATEFYIGAAYKFGVFD